MVLAKAIRQSRYSIARRQTDREPTKKWAHLMELQRASVT
jgi:hypothetical protein